MKSFDEFLEERKNNNVPVYQKVRAQLIGKLHPSQYEVVNQMVKDLEDGEDEAETFQNYYFGRKYQPKVKEIFLKNKLAIE